MNVRKHVVAIATGVAIFFTSCQKDLIVNEQDQTLTTQTSSDATADNVAETAPAVYTKVRAYVNSDVAGFGQAVPARYNLTTKKYPLIIFIHGIGELGTDLNINCCGLAHHLSNKTFPANFNVNGVNYSFLVIAPQFKVRPNAAQVQSVIEFAKKRWRVDETRIYVTGLSMGGGVTWDWSAVYGQYAAAIVPVCGGTMPTQTLTAKIASKNLPIWGLYSTSDQVVPVQWGRNFFSWIDAKNPGYAPRTKLTIWSGLSHNSTWGKAFNPTTRVDGFNIYEWMLLNKKGSAPASSSTSSTPSTSPAPAPTPSTTTNKVPVAKAGSDRTIYLSSGINRVTLDGVGSYDSDGSIVSYTWTKVSGPYSTMMRYTTTKEYAAHLVRGSYIFKLTVKDNKGATSSDNVSVFVK
jgi:acetyl esterase/lipase